MELTPASAKLFESLVDDAPNWSDEPLIDISPAEKGNLTHLKRMGLITTQIDRGDTFAIFTKAGADLAEKLHGYRPSGYPE